MKKSDIFWQTYLSLEKEALELSKYIFFTDEILTNKNGSIITQSCRWQLETFSPHIADLLVRCCVQIEAISKELYFDNGGTKSRGDTNILFDDDCLRLIDIKWQTHKKTVLIVAPSFNFSKNENKILKPLKKAHKRDEYWEKAYQAVKHDRYHSMQQGNVKAFLHALAALYLLNIYYRNDSWTTKFSEISRADYSMGSSIFSVAPPKTDRLLYENTPIISESPFVAKFNDKEYAKIAEIQKKENEIALDYYTSQPEINDPTFICQWKSRVEKVEKDPTLRVNFAEELGKYRINKKIPPTLPFEERKRRLLSSDEWKEHVKKDGACLKPEQITESNIQSQIDWVGFCYELGRVIAVKRNSWFPIAINKEICKIYIP